MIHLKKMIRLDPSDRVLFLTKDLNLIKEQLYDGLNLKMADLSKKDLLDDINTDIMTPAWVCFHYDPQEIAKRAYAGLTLNGERIFKDNALKDKGFKAIVSGERKGTGSSRETAAQCEAFSGIRLVFAASFAPIHQKNNINLGQIMGSYDLLIRLQAGQEIPIQEFLKTFDDFSRKIIFAGGLFPCLKISTPLFFKNSGNNKLRPMNMAQKIMAQKIKKTHIDKLFTGQNFIAKVDAGYSHEFTTAQVHEFLVREYGSDYKIKNAQNFAAFEDHLIYADEVSKFAPFRNLIETLRTKQKEFISRNGIRDFSAQNGISPGICHEVAREEIINPSDFIQATDSHTCMGGALNAFAYGVGATEYAALLATGVCVASVPKSIRFDLVGRLKNNCSAKDVMLFILQNFSRKEITLNKVMEFGGSGMRSLSIDERATLCNMATECGAKTGICEPDQKLMDWLKKRRKMLSLAKIESLFAMPDENCEYESRHLIDLGKIEPMVANPGDPNKGIPSDPRNGQLVSSLKNVKIDIAYGGSCTAGKYDDIDMYALVTKKALMQGLTLKKNVQFFIQYSSKAVAEYAEKQGYNQDFLKAGIRIIPPGCGACIGCGPGVSIDENQVTISAINRNFQGRSGPGKLYLASPLTVAASAFAGKIVAWQP